ncbi:subtilisin SUB3 [Besnoitia besnoiti]|uniref:subtilisin n=1 Tax=Besnoitia besnoiti TaxID=94643 RepID=A0A2A9M951_BESBE|nr:subtilisin SUB3 [Besnoitia besnoiti]PFH34419.1 subtilisin SUB3 [Besnoitia besnoiti]
MFCERFLPLYVGSRKPPHMYCNDGKCVGIRQRTIMQWSVIFLVLCSWVTVLATGARESAASEARAKETPASAPSTGTAVLAHDTLTSNIAADQDDIDKSYYSTTPTDARVSEVPDVGTGESPLDADEAPNPKKVASQIRFLRGARKTSRRVVLSYALSGCPPEKLEVGRAPERQPSLYGQEASNRTVNLLKDRISSLLHAKQTRKEVESVHSKPREEILGYGQDHHVSLRVTVEMETRYLSSLQMEVIKTIPEGVTDDEVISIARDLPCVEKAYHDSLKFSEQYLRRPGAANSDKSTVEAEGVPFLHQLHTTGSGVHSLDSLGVRVMKAFETGGSAPADDSDVQVPPNDPSFRLQWNLQDKAEFGLHTEGAWRLWTGEKRPMVIAVIDSGCDLDHPDLRANKWQNPGEICDDNIDNDGNGFVDDCHGWDFASDRPDIRSDATGHGTGAAGVLGATTNNLIGLAGVCWGCEIMCLKFIGGGQGTVSNQVQAIDYAVRMGAWISNNSYGGYGYSNLEFDAIRRAQTAGHLFVTSAGNHNLNTDLPQNDHTPSSYGLSNILSVGASTHFGRKAAFSNYGLTTVHIFAPGADIHTTEGLSGYSKVSGTSFACPHAAGVAGLVWSAFPNLTYRQVKQALIDGCKASVHLTSLAECGGILDAHKSLYIAVAPIPAGSTTQEGVHQQADLETVSRGSLLPDVARGIVSSLSGQPPFISVRTMSHESVGDFIPASPPNEDSYRHTREHVAGYLEKGTELQAHPPYFVPDKRHEPLAESRQAKLNTPLLQMSAVNAVDRPADSEQHETSTPNRFDGVSASRWDPSQSSGSVNAHDTTKLSVPISDGEPAPYLDEETWRAEPPQSFSLFNEKFLPQDRTATAISFKDDVGGDSRNVGPRGQATGPDSKNSNTGENEEHSPQGNPGGKKPEGIYSRASPEREGARSATVQENAASSRLTARKSSTLQAFFLQDGFSPLLLLGRDLLTFGGLLTTAPPRTN